MLSKFGLPTVPSISSTLGTSESFSKLIDIPFPLDTLHLVDPVTAPEGWEETFKLEPLAKLSTESRHFVLPITPYEIPPVGLFIPLEDVIDPTRPDPPTASHVLGLLQPKMFCADANDHERPMVPTSSEGWEKFVWNGEKHFWVSSTVGARIRVEIEVSSGRYVLPPQRAHYHS